jgi:hypothetical protein
MSDTIRVLGQR